VLPHLVVAEWGLLVVGAACAGFAKTAIGGVGAIGVALFALVLPARESTGTLLPLLLAGDLVAIRMYGRHTDWRLIRRLFPWVAAGVVVGALFVARIGDGGMRRTIGLLLLVLVVVQVTTQTDRMRRLLGDPGDGPVRHSHRLAAAVVGVLAGFTTMVANAAGSVMTIYLLLSGMAMMQFLGTGAWFFFLVNVFKLPFSIGLGLVDPGGLVLDLVLVPVLLLGAWAGIAVIRRIDQRQFERVALALVVVSVVPLLV
jgi:uncharacterized membrane protein YfcA